MLLQILGFSPLPSNHHQAADILTRESQWNPSTFICHCHPGWGIRLDLDPANTPRIPPWRSKPVNSGPAVGSPGNLSTGALQTGNTGRCCKSKIEPLFQKVPSGKEDFGWNVHQKACLGTVYCVYWTMLRWNRTGDCHFALSLVYPRRLRYRSSCLKCKPPRQASVERSTETRAAKKEWFSGFGEGQVSLVA